MKIEKKKLDELVSPEWNPRTISNEELEKLTNSIKEFGYSDPLIVNKRNNHIVAGNQRFKVLKELNKSKDYNFDEIDVVIVDFDETYEKAFNIAHNKISAEFDNEKLTQIFNDMKLEGFDLELTGFGDFELDFYLDNEDDDFFNPFDDESDLDYEDETPEDYMDVEGERTNEQYVVSISFTTREDANKFLKYINAPYELKQRSVGIHESEIFEDWREDRV